MATLPLSAPRPLTREHLDALWSGISLALGSLGDPASASRPPGPRPAAKAPAANDVNMLIAFGGEIEGQLLVGLSEPQALALCSRVLCVPIQGFDATASTTLAEIASRLAAACREELAQAGWRVNVSAPSVIAGAGVRVSWPAMYIQEGSFGLADQSAYLALGIRLDQRV